MRLPLLTSLLAASLLVAACAGEGDDERAADLIHRMVVAARADDSGTVERFVGELPEGLPVEPPLYIDADLIVSSRILGLPSAVDDEQAGEGEDSAGEDGAAFTALYFIVLDTDDDREDIFAFYQAALDEGPWHLDASASTREQDFLEFSKVDDLDISGRVQIVPGEDGGRTSIFISLQDSGALAAEEPSFEPASSLPPPSRFPGEVPAYPGAIITSTAFQRAPDSESFLLIFLTTDSQDAVLAYYKEELDRLGWTATEQEAGGSEVRLRFEDEAGTIDGELTADRFLPDVQYTEVDLRLQVSSAQEPPEGGATATPEATPDPE